VDAQQSDKESRERFAMTGRIRATDEIAQVCPMTIQDAERIVKGHYPKAHPFFTEWAPGYDGWSICDGTKTEDGSIRIRGVGFFATIDDAWQKAAEVVQQAIATRGNA
jgi:hypothetical protein